MFALIPNCLKHFLFIFLLIPNISTPKIFLDFPLIGTEDLHIPFVVNSPFFEPTEEEIEDAEEILTRLRTLGRRQR
jgi:hypothetical protein